jgi:hypothetical protein
MNDQLAEAKFSPVERFSVLLGNDVFFVPCEWGTKRPLVTYMERRKPESEVCIRCVRTARFLEG